ncbi:hypothetical protein JZ751_019669 [Albula glossodonta]|uniref:Uncharacterized protein n=1 Tax=Albula glossodonta TaxID=121402 RepID=A0A8T2NUN4_9TELE|nr:hypothetical protein JZ751_019669 [Albula glossodonta]
MQLPWGSTDLCCQCRSPPKIAFPLPQFCLMETVNEVNIALKEAILMGSDSKSTVKPPLAERSPAGK